LGAFFVALFRMKKVVLVFPDNNCIADFVIKYRVKGAEVNSSTQTLSAILSEEELRIASLDYGAFPRNALVSSFTKNAASFIPTNNKAKEV
jgi:hypothetical protein